MNGEYDYGCLCGGWMFALGSGDVVTDSGGVPTVPALGEIPADAGNPAAEQADRPEDDAN